MLPTLGVPGHFGSDIPTINNHLSTNHRKAYRITYYLYSTQRSSDGNFATLDEHASYRVF